MSFPPLEVKIQGHNSPMSEGRHYSLMCEAGGSRPPAALTWWMDGLLMTTADDQGMKEGNVSRTTVHLTPTRHNDGAIVSCRAENSEMPGAAMEDIIKLSVYYSPRLQLRAGQNLVMSNIKEGDDVYFECVIHANPPVQGVQWFLKGKELRHDVSAGIILTNQSLVLQKVGRQSSGDYACAASNTHGNATSKSIQLSVKFAPMCSEDQKLTYGSARGQQVNVSCHVDAHPEAHTFRWAFNTSTEVVHIPKNRTHFHRNRSVMTYTPKTHHDFGTLLCWASNDVGSQPQPCVYLVVPAAVPEAVHNCSAWHNASAAGEVVVSCEAGWSGGLTQTFTLEVRQMQSSGETGAVVASLEQLTQPHFTVTGLAPGAEYQLSVGASNSQGAAPNTLLIHHTPIDVAEKRTSAAAAESFGMGLDFLTMVPIVAVVAGAVASVVICSVVLVLVIRSRLRRGQNHAHSHAHGFSQPGGVYDKAAPHNNTCDDGGFDTVHRGPDLILVKSGREDRKRPGISPLTCSPSTATTLMGDQQVGSSSTVNNPARISTPNVIPARTSTPSVIHARTSTPSVIHARTSTPSVITARTSTPSVIPARTSTPSVITARTSTPSVIPARTETNTSASTNHRSLVNPSTGAMINPSTGAMINPSTGTMINPSTGTMINPSIGPDVKGLSSGDALMNAGPEALVNTSGNSAMFEMGSGGPPFGRITLSGDPLDSRMTRPGGLLVDGRITLSGDPLDNRMTRTGDLLDSRMPRSRDHSLEGRIARPVSVASPATLGRYHTRVGRSASCTGRGDIFSSTSTLPRRSSAIDIQPEFFPLNLSTSRESCV
ncbi:nephrin-like [Homarus americanus]|uniref:nephrin-like n=1 Tax=Homarus americanus TaxID=6706 RepID=UPI001C45C719|nr:nephrin-like [Homarus americanus]